MARTRTRVAAFIRPVPLSALVTVARDTSAAAATSMILIRPTADRLRIHVFHTGFSTDFEDFKALWLPGQPRIICALDPR